MAWCDQLYATPELANQAHGTVSISASGNGLQIDQKSSHAILNWKNFNIDPHESVDFKQPSGGICLNRIDSKNGMSQIHGKLTANGRIILINEAGILFGKNAKVNVGGIIASAVDMTNEDFLKDQYIFGQSKQKNGAIINRGSIHVDEHGLAVFLGSNVLNEGLIQSNMSKIILASGNKFTLDFYGDGVINVSINEKTLHAAYDEHFQVLNDGVKVSGEIINDAGDVVITGGAMQDVFDNLINLEGFVFAESAYEADGKIVLQGDSGAKIKITGKLDVAAHNLEDTKATGGVIHVLGTHLELGDTAILNAAGNAGGGEILIGGDYKGANPDIKNSSTTYIAQGATLNADAIISGDGGKIIIWSDDSTKYYGKAEARGGALEGNGGFLEISSKKDLIYDGALDLTAANGNKGNVLFDPQYLVVETSGGTAYASGTNNLYANNVGSTNTLTPASIVTAAASANITLQANTDVVFTDALVITTSGSTLTVNAGRSVLFNNNVSTTNAAITVTANDTGSTSGDRQTTNTNNPPGDAETTAGNITAASGISVSSGSGAMSMTIGSSVTAPYTPGSISLVSIAAGTVSLTSPNAVTVTTSLGASSTVSVSNGMASTINGTISGTTFAKAGAGTLTLGAANTYSGSTTINAGTLQAGIAAAIPSTSSVALANTAGAVFDLNGFSQSITSLTGGGTTGGNVFLTSGATLTQTTGNGAYGGVISGSGNLILNGSGLWFLQNQNTFTGSVTINSGSIAATISNIIADSSALIMGASGNNTFDSDGDSQTIGSLSGGNANTQVIPGSNSNPLTIKQTADGTFNGKFTGSGGIVLSSSSTNTLTLGTSSVNTVNLLFTLNGGTLAVNQDSNFGSVPGSPTAAAITINGGKLATLASFSLATNRGITLGSSGGTISPAFSTTLIYDGAITGSGSFTNSGTGKLTLGGANTYSGPTTVAAGTLSIASIGGLGNTSGTSVTSGAILDINLASSTLTNANAITLNGTGSAGSGALTFTGSAITINNPLTIASSSSIGGTASGAINLDGTISGANNLTISDTSANYNFSALDVSNPVSITANNATGAIAVGGLSLNTQECNLTGTVNGQSGTAGADLITIQNTITAGTHFFDSIDLFKSSPTPNSPSNVNITSQPVQTVINNMYYITNTPPSIYEGISSIYFVASANTSPPYTPPNAGIKCTQMGSGIELCVGQ